METWWPLYENVTGKNPRLMKISKEEAMAEIKSIGVLSKK